MNGKKLYKQIRLTSFRHIMVPVITIGICVLLNYFVPFNNVFRPISYESATKAILQYKNGAQYVRIEPEVLYYSGFDVKRGDEVVASYYYEVDSTACTFFLLEGDMIEDKPLKIENPVVDVKIVEKDGLFENLMNNFTNTIGWNAEGMDGVTNNLIMDQTLFNKEKYKVAFVIIMVAFAYSIVSALLNIVFIIFPYAHISLIKYYASHKGNVVKDLRDLEKDLEENIISEIDGIYITEDYLYNVGKKEVSIVPIKEIVMAYDHGKLISLLGIHLKVSHTMVFRCCNVGKITISGKSATDMAAVFEYIKEKCPDVLWGHTKENTIKAKEIIKEKRRKQ